MSISPVSEYNKFANSRWWPKVSFDGNQQIITYSNG